MIFFQKNIHHVCRFFFVRAGMMAWLFINLSLFAKSYLAGSANLSVILYQFFCAWYIVDYFVHEEFMTSTWDIIAERLGFMLVFGDLVFIPFTFTIQGWWLLRNKVELSLLAAVVNCFIFVIGYSSYVTRTCFRLYNIWPVYCILISLTMVYSIGPTAILCSEEPTNKNISSRRTLKLLFGVNLPNLSGGSYLYLATGELQSTAIILGIYC
jgi:hypothetical protein